jgi:serine/threonine protein kinase
VLSQQGHGFCVDYWGLGMLTYEMMTGLPPWYTTDRQKLFRRLKSAPLDIPNYFSPSAADCISSLLERNPRRRLGMAGIRSAMEHEFFRNISWRSLYAKRVEAPVKPCESWKPPETNGTEGPDVVATPSTIDTYVAMADPNELDAATSNFDSTFLRMPVESEDNPVEDAEDAAAAEELQDDTFIGFTFDSRELDRNASLSAPYAQRHRTHHYHKS